MNNIKKLVQTLLWIFVFFVSSNTYSQISTKKLNEDTLYIDFQKNFDLDVVVLYINDIMVFEGLLYSNITLGSARKELVIPYTKTDSLRFRVVYYKRNHRFSLEYNALWYDWSRKRDGAMYYKPKEINFTIYPKKQGKYIGIFIKNPEAIPSYNIEKEPFMYY